MEFACSRVCVGFSSGPLVLVSLSKQIRDLSGICLVEQKVNKSHYNNVSISNTY